MTIADAQATINPIAQVDDGDFSTIPDPSSLDTNATTTTDIGAGSVVTAAGGVTINALDSYQLVANVTEKSREVFIKSRGLVGFGQANVVARTTIEFSNSASRTPATRTSTSSAWSTIRAGRPPSTTPVVTSSRSRTSRPS